MRIGLIKMEIFSWKKAVSGILVLFVTCTSLYSQVVVERSKDKVIISGVSYYLHIVKKGETAYSISRAYGISFEELTRENPPALYGIKEGQALRIPVRSVTDQVAAQQVKPRSPRDETKFIYHSLKPGETVYSLSKSYGVSENEIITSNPGIDINKLSVGAEIAVPRRDFMSNRQQFNDQEKEFFYHKVLRGETLSSIASLYGLSVRELRRENRDLRFPQVGDYVRIPGIKAEEIADTISVKSDTTIAVADENLIIPDRLVEYTTVKDLKGSFNLAVLLPFYLKENRVRTEIDSSKYSKGKRVYKVLNLPEDWIYRPSIDFIEMYEGILLAADTLRSLGLEINIYAYDIKRDTVELTKLIMSGKLAGMDMIIGPVYSHNLSIVAAYARDLNIPVVSPVPLLNNSALLENPTLYMANSSLGIAQKALSKKISEYPDHNVVFIHADTAGRDSDVINFKNMIINDLTYKMPYNEIRFKEFTFYSRSMFNNDSINRLSHALTNQTDNIIVIASEDPAVISETMQDIHGLSKKFNIKVFGYPVMREIDNLEQKILFDLGTMVYTPYWIDYSQSDVKQFNADFRRKFLTEPFENSYAWEGYDITYYFLSGIAMNGDRFLSQPRIHNPDLLQTQYDFLRKEIGSGFENHNLYLIRYTKDYEIKIVKEDVSYMQN